MSQESHEKKFIGKPGWKVVKHFKRELDDPASYDHLYIYQDIATHSETKEKYVVYSSLDNHEKIWIRPYDMFMSEVDHEKYPDIKQKYRFEIMTQKEKEDLKKAIFESRDEKTPLTSEDVNILAGLIY